MADSRLVMGKYKMSLDISPFSNAQRMMGAQQGGAEAGSKGIPWPNLEQLEHGNNES